MRMPSAIASTGVPPRRPRRWELLRFSELGPAYERAWDEWHRSGESAVWEGADKDAYVPESRETG